MFPIQWWSKWEHRKWSYVLQSKCNKGNDDITQFGSRHLCHIRRTNTLFCNYDLWPYYLNETDSFHTNEEARLARDPGEVVQTTFDLFGLDRVISSMLKDLLFSIFNNILYTEHINLFGPFMKVRARRARGLMNPLCVSLFSPPQPYQRLRSNIDRYFEGHKVCIWLQVCIFCCEKKLAYYGVWYRVGFWMELLWL